MRLLVNIFVILITLKCGLTHNILIKDYFISNHITTVLLISCESKNEINTIHTIENLQRYGIWINIWDISMESVLTNFDYHRFFVRFSNPPSIVINLECNQTTAFLAQMSKRVLFHSERKWLMLSGRLEDSLDILNKQNINFDAEINLVIPSVRQHYEIYEVFNPSYNRGGRLNITQVGNWSAEIGWNIQLKQTKIERRHDLNGITFPTVIPVTNSY